MSNEQIARAFSGHRFHEALEHLHPGVRWDQLGQDTMVGAEAVRRSCDATSAELSRVETTWLRFVCTGEGGVVAVDGFGRYDGGDVVSFVTSCDIYEFTDGEVSTITSYAVESDPDDPKLANHGAAETDRDSQGALIVSGRTLLERVGGVDAIHQFESVVYDSVLLDPVLAPLFPTRKPHHVEHLTAFTAESFGGDDRFTRELGFEHLIDVHRGLVITEDQRRRFVQLYIAAIDQVGLTEDADVRAAVISHIEFGAEVATRNSRAQTDDQLHPLRSVPHWTVASTIPGERR